MSARNPEPIKNLTELKAALQLAVGLELSTIPVYLTALYSIKDGTNPDAAQTIRSVVMEEMLHMALAANVLNCLGEKPSTGPVEFRGRQVNPVPAYPFTSPLVSGIGELALRPLTPEAVDCFVRIEHPHHGASSPAEIKCPEGGYPTIGEFYDAISAALQNKKICKDADFKAVNQVKATQYYGGAGEVVEVKDRGSALAAIHRIVDQGEGLPEKSLKQPAKTVTTEDRLGYGWQMYSHYARFRELQTGRRFRSTQTAGQTPAGALLLVDYEAVHPAEFVKPNGATTGGPEGAALNEFDLAYTQLVDDLYLAFSGGQKEVGNKAAPGGKQSKDPLLLAVHDMHALKYRAVALMRTPMPGSPQHTLCPRFGYATTPDDRRKLRAGAEQMRGQTR
ncbi:ferritin-like protein [Streptomyces sp. FXJ1.172]|uniref:ferritin-like domain-containing protein n=1 Tax=Streptomyces sp. FXJ1.172 TaxID=710705 RepID=UPI0007CF9D85|nr:ferritin-like protein [Streptomyces sp. FXJ1.172]WEO93743.1 ferritin-like protein [Streptomyces sp. FXJ1.172]